MVSDKRVLIVSTTVDIRTRINQYVESKQLPHYQYIYLIEYFAEDITESRSSTYYPIKNFSNHEELSALIEKIGTDHKLHDVVSVDEFSVYAASLIRQYQKLAGLSPEDARCFRDKLVMKERLAASSVSVSKRVLAADLFAGNVHLPVVVKPRSMAGAEGVEIIRSEQALQAILQDAAPATDTYYRDMDEEQLFCEEYIDGPIWHLDCCVKNRTIMFWSLSQYKNTPLDYINGMPLGSIIIPREEVPSSWVETFQSIISALPCADGVYHIELIGQLVEKPYFLEIGYRPGGAYVKDAVMVTYGLDLLLIHLSLQLGLNVNMLPTSINNDVSGWLIFPKDHKSDMISFVESVKLPQQVLRSTLLLSVLPKAGTQASGEFYSHEDSLGGFVLTGNRDDINHDFTWIEENYEIRTKTIENSH